MSKTPTQAEICEANKIVSSTIEWQIKHQCYVNKGKTHVWMEIAKKHGLLGLAAEMEGGMENGD